MQTTMVLTQRIMMFMQVTKLLISGNMKGLSWTRLYTHLATISRGAMYVHKMKEKVFDLSELSFSSFICTLLSQSGMVEGTWALASDKPCISQSGTLGWTGFKSARGGEIQGVASGTAVSRCPNDNVILYLSTSPSWAHECPRIFPVALGLHSPGITTSLERNLSHREYLTDWEPHSLRKRWKPFLEWNGMVAGQAKTVGVHSLCANVCLWERGFTVQVLLSWVCLWVSSVWWNVCALDSVDQSRNWLFTHCVVSSNSLSSNHANNYHVLKVRHVVGIRSISSSTQQLCRAVNIAPS